MTEKAKTMPHLDGLSAEYASALLARLGLMRALAEAIEAESACRAAFIAAAGEPAADALRAQYLFGLETPHHA